MLNTLFRYVILMFSTLVAFTLNSQRPVRLVNTNLTNSELIIQVHNPINKTIVLINLPDSIQRLSKQKKTLLVFYALPNGNSIEWTMGKLVQANDDWHYDIQHIAAQTRWLREVMKDYHVIVAYMANEQKSWPAWKKQQFDGPKEIKRIVDSLIGMFSIYHPQVMLNSHSGGGSFIFGYLEAVEKIPDEISRIAFIDSDYGYEDSLHSLKLINWLKSSKKHYLNVLAYNDSVVIYNNKPLVSATGGTWYRSKMMQRTLSEYFPCKTTVDSNFIHYNFLLNRISIDLKINKERKIYHTEQVARNGFIHTVIYGTKYQKKREYIYWGDRVYNSFIY